MGGFRDRLAAFARAWLGPGLAGLLGAAVLIAGVEAGGWIGWATIAAAALGLLGLVVWATRTLVTLDEDLASWPDLGDEPLDGGPPEDDLAGDAPDQPAEP